MITLAIMTKWALLLSEFDGKREKKTTIQIYESIGCVQKKKGGGGGGVLCV